MILIRNVLDATNIFNNILSPLVDRISRSTASQRHKYLFPHTSAFSFITAGENIRVARASASFRHRFRDMLLGRRGDPPHTHPASCEFIYSPRWAMYDSCTAVYDTRRILCGGGSPRRTLRVSTREFSPAQSSRHLANSILANFRMLPRMHDCLSWYYRRGEFQENSVPGNTLQKG